MRTRGTNSEVAKAFAESKEGPCKNHGSGGSAWHGSRDSWAIDTTMHHERQVLYSYRQPIARILDNGHCLVDVDRYSHTTNQHQHEARSALRAAGIPIFEVSFSCLRAHNVDFVRDDIETLDATDDINIEVYGDVKPEWSEDRIPDELANLGITYDNFETIIRRRFGNLGIISKHEANPKDKYSNYEAKSFHLTGSSLVQANGKLIWSSVDHGDYFACQISEQVNTIIDAMLTLRPAPIRDREDLIRQGEFFFAPADIRPPKELIEKWVRLTDMVRQGWPVNCGQNHWGRRIPDRRSGHHTAQFFVPGRNANEAPIVSGKIKDRQHGCLDLGSQWYEAYHNTQVVSYSASQFGTRID